MRFYLQMGYGMMALAEQLIEEWPSSGVILSPRDQEESQLIRVSRNVRKSDGEVLFDPQCYAHDADHEKLSAHEYFQVFLSNSTVSFNEGKATDKLLESLSKLATRLGIERHILPARQVDTIDDSWFGTQKRTIDSATKYFDNEPLLATIALSKGAILDEKQVEAIVEGAAKWPVSGFYVVIQGEDPYLQENPVWIANVLLLVSGLRLLGKEVVMGYANHQLICLAAAKVNILASGTFLNVRCFDIGKYFAPEEKSPSRRTTWYYCPQAYSEYKIPFLDMAKRMGALEQLMPSKDEMGIYASPLFTGAIPTSVNWKEPQAFRHYLTALRSQVISAVKPTFDESFSAYVRSLDDAESIAEKLANKGVPSGDRGVKKFADASRSAMAVFRAARESRLSRNWNQL